MGLALNEIAGGSSAWKPENIGDTIKGTIVSIERRQQTDFSTNAPLTWDDGTPRLQTVVVVQTDERTSDDDDGRRTLYLKGGRNHEAKEGTGHSGEVALAEAAKAAGATSVDEGATLTFRLTGTAKPTQRGYQPARLYQAKYEPPRQSVAAADLWDE